MIENAILTLLKKSSLLLCLLIFVSCLKDSDVESEVGAWRFSGKIIDGASEMPLPNATITYPNSKGEILTAVTDSEGNFFIDGLPYGERTFKFSLSPSDTTFTQRTLTIAATNESSSLGGVIGDVARVVKLFPRTGKIVGEMSYQPQGTDYQLPAKFATVKISFNDSTMKDAEPGSITVRTDSLGRYSFTGLPVAPGATLSFSNFQTKGITYTALSLAVPEIYAGENTTVAKVVYKTTDTTSINTSIIASNVLTKDGFGLSNVSIDATLWYKLPVTPKTGTVLVELTGAGSPKVTTKISSDTVFATPVVHFSYDSTVTTKIMGIDTAGEKFEFVLSGIKQFRTEKSVYPVAANFWSQPWVKSGFFSTYDTLWVKFSATLDTGTSEYQWTESSAESNIFGNGSKINAKTWVKADTLFLVPDQRLQLSYSSTLGFKVKVRTSGWKFSDEYDFVAKSVDDPLQTVWTNTKDAMGNLRTDLGLKDTVKVLPSVSKYSVVGVSVGSNGAVPSGLGLSDVKMSGDTIIYVPSFSLLSDTTYSIDFDIKLADGQVRRNVCGVHWGTKKRVSIVNFNTKSSNLYRQFSAYGDSFTVTFSEPIDTSVTAEVRFAANIKDVLRRTRKSAVSWSPDARTATVRILDTLPTADYDAPVAYTVNSTKTKAVESVTFNLITKAGEIVFDCKPDGDAIQLHTEAGMCVVASNVVPNIGDNLSLEKDFVPTTEFVTTSPVELRFNRQIDTSKIKIDSLELYFGLHKPGAVKVDSKISILPDLKTVQITPVTALGTKTEYYIWAKNVPAMAIGGAAAISKHSGTYSGKSSSYYILDRPFKTQ